MYLILGIFIFVTSFFPSNTQAEYAKISIGGVNFFVVELLFFLTFLSWLLRLLLKKERPLKSNLNLFLLLLYSYISIPLIIGMLREVPLNNILYDSRAFFYYISYPIALTAIRTPKRLKLLIQLFLAGLTIYSLLPVLVYSEVDYSVATLLRNQITEFRIGGQNEQLFVLAFPLLVSLIVFTPSKTERLLYIALIPSWILKIILGNSRTMFIALAVSLIILPIIIVKHKDYMKMQIRGALIVTTMLFMFLLGIITIQLFPLLLSRTELGRNTQLALAQRFAESFTKYGVRHELVSRQPLYEISISTMLDNPIIGYGFGGIDTGETGILLRNDNTWLMVGTKMGVIGLILFVLIYVKFAENLVYVYKHLKAIDSAYIQAFIVAMVSAFPGFLIMSMNTINLVGYQIVFVLIAFMAAIEYIKNLIKKRVSVYNRYANNKVFTHIPTRRYI